MSLFAPPTEDLSSLMQASPRQVRAADYTPDGAAWLLLDWGGNETWTAHSALFPGGQGGFQFAAAAGSFVEMSASTRLIVAAHGELLELWDRAANPQGDQTNPTFGLPGNVLSVSFTPDDQYIVFCGEFPFVLAVHVPSGQYRQVIDGGAMRVKFSPQGRLLGALADTGAVRVLNIRDWSEQLGGSTWDGDFVLNDFGSVLPVGESVTTMDLDLDGRVAASILGSGQLVVQRYHTGSMNAEAYPLAFHPEGLRLAISPRGTELAAGWHTAEGADSEIIDLTQTPPRGRLLESAPAAPEAPPEVPAAPILENGLVLGLYRLERHVADGAETTVWEAKGADGESVVLKILPKNAPADSQKGFVQEQKTLTAVKHAHLVPLLNSGETEWYSYHVFPYYERGSLAQYPDTPTWKVFRSWTVQLLGALQTMHDRGYAHLDVNAYNCLLSGDKLILGDLGSSQPIGRLARPARVTSGYAAPELESEEPACDGRSDVYAVGIMLRSIFGESEEIPELWGAIQQATDPDPVNRYRTCMDMAAVLMGRVPPSRRLNQRRPGTIYCAHCGTAHSITTYNAEPPVPESGFPAQVQCSRCGNLVADLYALLVAAQMVSETVETCSCGSCGVIGVAYCLGCGARKR